MGLIIGIPLAVSGAALLIGGIIGYKKFETLRAKESPWFAGFWPRQHQLYLCFLGTP
jgi:hypothetical protein